MQGNGLAGVYFRNDGNALDIFSGCQGAEHPYELVNRFCLVLFIIGDRGQQAFHEGFICQADQAELIRNAQRTGFHPGKDGNDLVAPCGYQGGHIRMFFKRFGQVFKEERRFKRGGNQDGIPSLFRKAEKTFLHELVALQRIRRQAQAYRSVPLVPKVLRRMMRGGRPVAVQIGKVAALVGGAAHNAGDAVRLEPELGLLRGTVKYPADAFGFGNQLGKPLVRVIA